MHKYRILFWSIGVSLAGLLFGADLAVISDSKELVRTHQGFGNNQYVLTIIIALCGAIVGSIISGIALETFGRKKALKVIALIFFLTAWGSAFHLDLPGLLVFRFMAGLSVGATSVVVPVYISEISPADKRGRLMLVFQFNIFSGVLIYYLVISSIGSRDSSWLSFLLGILALPSLFLLFVLRFVPESPRWLIRQGKAVQALKIFNSVQPGLYPYESINLNHSDLNQERAITQKSLFNPVYRKPLILAILFTFFNGVSGINIIIYYAPQIFELAGLPSGISIHSIQGIGFINLLFTLFAILFIDRMGRKTLMIIGTGGLIITLGLVSFSFYHGWFNEWSVPFFLFIYVGFFSFSQGAAIWVFIAEIFPNEIRASGQAFGSIILWFMATLLTLLFPWFSQKAMTGHIFLFFTIMMCFQLFVVCKLMPETKGKSLEQLSASLYSDTKWGIV